MNVLLFLSLPAQPDPFRKRTDRLPAVNLENLTLRRTKFLLFLRVIFATEHCFCHANAIPRYRLCNHLTRRHYALGTLGRYWDHVQGTYTILGHTPARMA